MTAAVKITDGFKLIIMHSSPAGYETLRSIIAQVSDAVDGLFESIPVPDSMTEIKEFHSWRRQLDNCRKRVPKEVRAHLNSDTANELDAQYKNAVKDFKNFFTREKGGLRMKGKHTLKDFYKAMMGVEDGRDFLWRIYQDFRICTSEEELIGRYGKNFFAEDLRGIAKRNNKLIIDVLNGLAQSLPAHARAISSDAQQIDDLEANIAETFPITAEYLINLSAILCNQRYPFED